MFKPRLQPSVLLAALLLCLGIGLPAASAAPPNPVREWWVASGGASGPMGELVDQSSCDYATDHCWELYANGGVYWHYATGVHAVRFALAGEFNRQGGPNGTLGYPTTDEACGKRDGGCAQEFQHGTELWSPTTGARTLLEPIRTLYRSLGWENGPLRYPVTNQVCGMEYDGCAQDFQGGTILWPQRKGLDQPVSVRGALRDQYRALGSETGPLGYPLGDEGCGKRDGGCAQPFEGATMFWSAATGAHSVQGWNVVAYNHLGWENGILGYPAAEAGCGKRDGGCSQDFQGGTMMWLPKLATLASAHETGGTLVVRGALRSEYQLLGWENGVLGYPVANEGCGKRGGGCAQEFQGGTILWSPAGGGHEVRGALRNAYQRSGWENGALGYPISDEACGKRDGGCSQEFEGGTLLWSPAAGAHSVTGSFRDQYRAQGWENGRLGYPTSDGPTTASGPAVQLFQGGTLRR
ncbi:hypothetical protein [Modestobacter sp. NPDC049651]|uniref:LGFP repeat-containing protein n=1 Tax=unclassified Modestobacter TaxID=2643866 RepID=UPI00340388C8